MMILWRLQDVIKAMDAAVHLSSHHCSSRRQQVSTITKPIQNSLTKDLRNALYPPSRCHRAGRRLVTRSIPPSLSQLTDLLAHLAADLKKSHPDWPLTVFFRNTAADEYFKTQAVADRIVHGTLADTETIRALSKEHDIVINAVSSFNGELVDLIISGMEERPASSKGTLIHLSGTGNFIDYGTSGNFNPQSKVWNVRYGLSVPSHG